jgi:predicted nucleic acid-binding protein
VVSPIVSLNDSTDRLKRTRSFANGILIAASARELGAIIVTENSADFSIIASVLNIRFTQPQDVFEIS